MLLDTLPPGCAFDGEVVALGSAATNSEFCATFADGMFGGGSNGGAHGRYAPMAHHG